MSVFSPHSSRDVKLPGSIISFQNQWQQHFQTVLMLNSHEITLKMGRKTTSLEFYSYLPLIFEGEKKKISSLNIPMYLKDTNLDAFYLYTSKSKINSIVKKKRFIICFCGLQWIQSSSPKQLIRQNTCS